MKMIGQDISLQSSLSSKVMTIISMNFKSGHKCFFSTEFFYNRKHHLNHNLNRNHRLQ